MKNVHLLEELMENNANEEKKSLSQHESCVVKVMKLFIKNISV